MKDVQIKELWLAGHTYTAIAEELKMGFDTVKRRVIKMGIEDVERPTIRGKIFKNVDRHTGKIEVKLDKKTWVYLDPKHDIAERTEFKRKQLKL